MSQLVFDLETVLDPCLKWEPKDETSFAPPIHHQIVAIGYCWISDGGLVKRMGVLGPDESQALYRFVHGVLQGRPQLVGFNSRRFDVPVLAARCFRHGIGQGWAEAYGNRYKPQYHLDIADRMTNYGAAAPCKLDTWARAMGLPGKRDVNGGDVADLWAAGDWEKIAAYCLEDVITTALVAARAIQAADDYAIAAKEILAAAEKEPRLYGWCADLDRALVLPQPIAAE